jgi:hypothetical protein
MDETKETADETDGGDKSGGNESSKLADPPSVPTSYSTRGRAQVEHALDRMAAVGDLLSLSGTTATTATAKKPSTSSALFGPPPLHHQPRETALPPTSTSRMRESFLSDSLTEEERRTRTRYLPDVEGMHALRKQEIKADLALARSMLVGGGGGNTAISGVSSNDRPKTTSKRVSSNSRQAAVDEDPTGGSAMDVESALSQSGDDAQLSEEDRTATLVGISSSSSRTIDIGGGDRSLLLNVPSSAFVTPPESGNSSGSHQRSTPREVEAVAAFNPPRPPESMGAKKKHRLLRWERRPADMEADLNSYRKTVQRTREELKNAKDECVRITTVDHELRRHFLQHIACLKEELARLEKEIAVVQQECIDLADLPSTGRTRTRNSKGNVSAAMRDVIQMLRAKGKDMEARGLSLPLASSSSVASNVTGVGGVTAVSFSDCGRPTIAQPTKLAQGWIVPGDRVQTPYGEGTVSALLGPGTLRVDESKTLPLEGQKEDGMEVDNTEDPLQANEPATTKALKMDKTNSSQRTNESLANALAPRVCVSLPFGTAFSALESVVSLEDPAVYTDEQMAKRWSGIAQTALAQGASLDVSAMTHMEVAIDSARDRMDVDGTDDTATSNKKRRLVPFGASLFPTAIGRGTLLHKASLSELGETVKTAYFKGRGVLGMRDNERVPPDLRELEDSRQERLILQAKVLQLRNQLYRQRRIRLLNERTHAASQERASRVESLVAEMRMDLKSLKNRLDLEIRDLGISEVQAESILKSYYMSLDSQHSGEASPPKRHRRLSRTDGDDEDQVDPGGIRESAETEMDPPMAAMDPEELSGGTKL